MTNLTSEQIGKLILLLKEKPRATRQSNREYIDTGNNLQLVKLARHAVVFGRRGSGKTMLLGELASAAATDKSGIVWIDIDDYKTLTFPDILVQILRSLFAAILKDVRSHNAWWFPWKRLGARSVIASLQHEEKYLKDLLQRFEEADASREESKTSKSTFERTSNLGADRKPISAKIGDKRGSEDSTSSKETVAGKDKKIDRITRHLHDAKNLLRDACSRSHSTYFIVLDDFYHLSIDDQSLVLDFLQSLTKNLEVFIKFGTIAHRSRLYRKDGQIISGMQKEHDVLAIDLDRTFQNYTEVEQFIGQLWKQISDRVKLEQPEALFAGNSWKQLVLASGGTPRDFMNILAKALELGRSRGKDKLDVFTVNEAANLYLRDTKHEDLISDGKDTSGELENLLMDIRQFCVDEKKRNLFLVHKEMLDSRPEQLELLRQLVDYRFIHLVHQNTSASGKTGRYEAYMLDVGLYSHPQRRGNNKVKQVDFLLRDEQNRADAVRTQPVYPLRDTYTERTGDPFAPLEATADESPDDAHADETGETGQQQQRLLQF